MPPIPLHHTHIRIIQPLLLGRQGPKLLFAITIRPVPSAIIALRPGVAPILGPWEVQVFLEERLQSWDAGGDDADVFFGAVKG